jgi:hypothetical protein
MDDEGEKPPASKHSTTFGDNLSMPVHRWFKYSAGFSARWVQETIQTALAGGREQRVLDPFAGSATVLVQAQEEGISSIGVESHPFVAQVARVKTQIVNPEGLTEYFNGVLKRASKIEPSVDGYSPLIRKCYPDESLQQLDQLKQAWLKCETGPKKDLVWLILASILRQCSPVGTANWQYILPNKSKARISYPLEAFKAKATQVALDCQNRRETHEAQLIQGDARNMIGVPDDWATLVITSPPYPNNFDYADATRLEMTFFGDVAGWGDLQDVVRRHLVRSCTQHVSPIVKTTAEILASPELDPIREDIERVVGLLDAERHLHGGKKNYHTMIAAYFLDMAKVWIDLRRVTTADARVCFVIGDSAPYGIHVCVDEWMGKLAIKAGFESYMFTKTRDRNTKWKNRKHRVPLHEGHLWVEG